MSSSVVGKLFDLPSDMFLSEISARLDRGSRCLLAATCRQARTLLAAVIPTGGVTMLEVLKECPLRFADRILARLTECSIADTKFYAMNRHHESLESILQGVRRHADSALQMAVMAVWVFRGLVEASRDDFIREWQRSSDKPVRLSEISALVKWETFFTFLERDDFLAIFGKHDLLPYVTRLPYNESSLLTILADDAFNSNAVSRLLALVRAYEPIAQAVRTLLDRIIIVPPGGFYAVIFCWHASRLLDGSYHRRIDRVRSDIGRTLARAVQSQFETADTLGEILSWLTDEIVDRRRLTEAFMARPIANGNDLVGKWKLVDARGWIDVTVLSDINQLWGLLSTRSRSDIIFFLHWARQRPEDPVCQTMADLLQFVLDH